MLELCTYLDLVTGSGVKIGVTHWRKIHYSLKDVA